MTRIFSRLETEAHQDNTRTRTWYTGRGPIARNQPEPHKTCGSEVGGWCTYGMATALHVAAADNLRVALATVNAHVSLVPGARYLLDAPLELADGAALSGNGAVLSGGLPLVMSAFGGDNTTTQRLWRAPLPPGGSPRQMPRA